jgi:hypothetical protein
MGAALVVGCSTETNTVPGEKCVGGFVRPETGACEAKCEDAKCKAGNRCVDNRCSLGCAAQRDCADQLLCDDNGKCVLESFRCAEAVTDTEEPFRACIPNGLRNSPMAPGYACPVTGNECGDRYCPLDPMTGTALRCDPYACGNNPTACTANPGDPNNGTCAGTGEPCAPSNCSPADCKLSLYCPNGLQCDTQACGGDPSKCVQDCEGDRCNVGKCSDTGEPCVFMTCPFNECKLMTCISVGEGDANAYCATVDCAVKDEMGATVPDHSRCAGGYFCGAARDPHDVCGATCSGTCMGGPDEGDTCGNAAECQAGNEDSGIPWEGKICGATTDPTCIDIAAKNTEWGANFFEGARCLLRYTCIEADSCAPCQSSTDCTVGDANVCISLYEEKVCARFCGSDADCRSDHVCVGYTGLSGATGTCENAPSVDCVVADECPDSAPCVARSVCIPKAGPCRPGAAAPSKFCQHCTQDADCGDAASGWACVEVSSGEFACLDFKTECMSDTDCPMAPSGARGTCMVDGLNQVDASDPTYNRCFAPLDSAEGKFTCYP